MKELFTKKDLQALLEGISALGYFGNINKSEILKELNNVDSEQTLGNHIKKCLQGTGITVTDQEVEELWSSMKELFDAFNLTSDDNIEKEPQKTQPSTSAPATSLSKAEELKKKFGLDEESIARKKEEERKAKLIEDKKYVKNFILANMERIEDGGRLELDQQVASTNLKMTVSQEELRNISKNDLDGILLDIREETSFGNIVSAMFKDTVTIYFIF